MLRVCLSALLLLSTLPAFGQAALTTQRPISVDPAVAIQPKDFWSELKLLGGSSDQLIAAACCKICSKGKACGDSCISRSKQCHKGAGCACDG